jgi:Ca2+-binding EF-hand superfamily protein
MFLRAMLAPAALAALTALYLLLAVPAAHAGTDGAGAFFRAVDRNGDGLISPAEMAAHRDRRVAEVDADRDGYVTQVEFISGRSLPADTIEQQAWMQKRSALFRQLDLNGDGVVSPAERRTVARRAFDRYDRDGDGGLSLAEIERAR